MQKQFTAAAVNLFENRSVWSNFARYLIPYKDGLGVCAPAVCKKYKYEFPEFQDGKLCSVWPWLF